MSVEVRNKVITLLRNRQHWPLLVEGLTANDLPTAVILPATIKETEMGILPDVNGFKYPKWIMTILIKARDKKEIILCLDGIDALPFDEQLKFYGLLKNKGLNAFALPEQTQIVVTAKQFEKVAPEIKNLCLLVK